MTKEELTRQGSALGEVMSTRNAKWEMSKICKYIIICTQSDRLKSGFYITKLLTRLH